MAVDVAADELLDDVEELMRAPELRQGRSELAAQDGEDGGTGEVPVDGGKTRGEALVGVGVGDVAVLVQQRRDAVDQLVQLGDHGCELGRPK